jgi:hypothetical protein
MPTPLEDTTNEASPQTMKTAPCHNTPNYITQDDINNSQASLLLVSLHNPHTRRATLRFMLSTMS